MYFAKYSRMWNRRDGCVIFSMLKPILYYSILLLSGISPEWDAFNLGKIYCTMNTILSLLLIWALYKKNLIIYESWLFLTIIETGALIIGSIWYYLHQGDIDSKILFTIIFSIVFNSYFCYCVYIVYKKDKARSLRVRQIIKKIKNCTSRLLMVLVPSVGRLLEELYQQD